MKKQKMWFATVAFLFGVIGTVSAQEGDPAQMELINQALELSGFNEQMEVMPEALRGSMQNSMGPMDPEIGQQLEELMTSAFTVEHFRESIMGHLVDHFDQTHYETIVEWFKSPLAQKVRTLEQEMQNPENANAMIAFMTELQTSPPPEARKALVGRLDEATQTSHYAVESSIMGFRATMKALGPLLSPEEKDQMAQEEETMRSIMGSQMQPILEASLLFVFRSISDEELTQYVTFWETETGRWFSQLQIEATLEAMQRPMDEVSSGLERIFGQLENSLEEQSFSPEQTPVEEELSQQQL